LPSPASKSPSPRFAKEGVGLVAPGVWGCGSGCVGLCLRVCGVVPPGVWGCGSGCVGLCLRVCGSGSVRVCGSGSVRVCGSVPPNFLSPNFLPNCFSVLPSRVCDCRTRFRVFACDGTRFTEHVSGILVDSGPI
jgi:hypothetical protein